MLHWLDWNQAQTAIYATFFFDFWIPIFAKIDRNLPL